MSELDKTIITPATATGIVQGSYKAVTDLMPFAQVLPDEMSDSPTSVRWINNKRMDQRMAEFTAFGANLPYTRQSTMQASTADILKLGMREMVGEREIAMGATTEYLRNKLTAYLEQLGAEIAWRVELARLQAFTDATFQAQNVSYDFDRKAEQNVTVSTNKWGTANADPIADIVKWQNTVLKETGIKPTTIFITNGIMEFLQTSAKLISLIPTYGTAPSRVGREEVNGVLLNHCGITNVVVLDEVYSSLGVKLPEDFIVPDKTVVLAANPMAVDMGRTVFGATAAANSAEYGISNPNGMGLVGYVTADHVPATYDAVAEGTVLPVLENSNLTLKAVVA